MTAIVFHQFCHFLQAPVSSANVQAHLKLLLQKGLQLLIFDYVIMIIKKNGIFSSLNTSHNILAPSRMYNDVISISSECQKIFT